MANTLGSTVGSSTGLSAPVKRTFTLRELRAHAARLRRRRRQLVAIFRSGRLDARLREQIMYGVSLTNDCRYCQVAHETFSLHAGASPEQLAAIVGQDPSNFEPTEWTAIVYAQALAARDFDPVPELRAELERAWGPGRCDDVEAVLSATFLEDETAVLCHPG